MKDGSRTIGGMKNLKRRRIVNIILLYILDDWVQEMEEEMRKMREEHEKHFKDFDK
jgi:hypothetical protein